MEMHEAWTVWRVLGLPAELGHLALASRQLQGSQQFSVHQVTCSALTTAMSGGPCIMDDCSTNVFV
jgi:hypothetical protein